MSNEVYHGFLFGLSKLVKEDVEENGNRLQETMLFSSGTVSLIQGRVVLTCERIRKILGCQ